MGFSSLDIGFHDERFLDKLCPRVLLAGGVLEGSRDTQHLNGKAKVEQTTMTCTEQR